MRYLWASQSSFCLICVFSFSGPHLELRYWWTGEDDWLPPWRHPLHVLQHKWQFTRHHLQRQEAPGHWATFRQSPPGGSFFEGPRQTRCGGVLVTWLGCLKQPPIRNGAWIWSQWWLGKRACNPLVQIYLPCLIAKLPFPSSGEKLETGAFLAKEMVKEKIPLLSIPYNKSESCL